MSLVAVEYMESLKWCTAVHGLRFGNSSVWRAPQPALQPTCGPVGALLMLWLARSMPRPCFLFFVTENFLWKTQLIYAFVVFFLPFRRHDFGHIKLALAYHKQYSVFEQPPQKNKTKCSNRGSTDQITQKTATRVPAGDAVWLAVSLFSFC